MEVEKEKEETEAPPEKINKIQKILEDQLQALTKVHKNFADQSQRNVTHFFRVAKNMLLLFLSFYFERGSNLHPRLIQKKLRDFSFPNVALLFKARQVFV